MYTVSEMKKFRDEYGISYEEISKKSGVPISTVQKIFGDIVKRPRKSTLEALSKVFVIYDWRRVTDLPNDYSYSRKDLDTIGMVAEKHQFNIFSKGSSAIDITDGSSSGEIYTQRGYTYNDYSKLDFPEGIMMEVLDGRLITMESPTTVHQIIAGEMFSMIRNFIRSNKGKCIPFISPVDARVEYMEDGSDMTIFKPDILIVCDKKKVAGMKTINGAPDFVTEVLSPSTRKYDMYEKMNKYRECGVREYWVVDIKKDKVIKYHFENEGEITIYTMHDKVPVEIYDGKLMIDFGEIMEYIESIYG